MNRIKLFFSILLVPFFVSCGSADQSVDDDVVKISGTVANPADEGMIVIENYGTQGMQVLDTLNLEGNSFSYQGDLQPGFYRLNFYDQQFVNIVYDNKPIRLNVDGDQPTGKVEFTGESQNTVLQDIRTMISEFQGKVQEMNSAFMQTGKQEDEVAVKQLYDDVNTLQEEYGDKLKQKINDMGISLAALQASTYLDPEKELDFMGELARNLKQQYPENQDVQDYFDQIQKYEALAIGSDAPGISLKNPQGETISLSSFRGNYVLVDFWAAWCRPCRMENPNVVEAYNKFKDEGFQILGVSLDRNKEDWVQAIEKDGLVWKQVWDEQNSASQKYNVNAIPANFLLDSEGKIVAKNLRGEDLQQKLQEVFN